MFSGNNRVQFGKALPVQVSHRFVAESAVFDDDSLVSCAGLVPVMGLAEQTGLRRLLGEKVRISAPADQVGVGEPGAEAGHRGGRRACAQGRTASMTSTCCGRGE